MSSEEGTLDFINCYRSLPVLWDNKFKDYTNKVKRMDALNVLASKFDMDIVAVKLKIKSLRSYFSKERVKVLKTKSGSGAEESYTSTWFAYKALLFIADSTTPRETKDSVEDNEHLVSIIYYLVLKSRTATCLNICLKNVYVNIIYTYYF